MDERVARPNSGRREFVGGMHELCRSCSRVLHRYSLDQDIMFPEPADCKLEVFEVFRLHENLQLLRASAEAQCHFCTLAWRAIYVRTRDAFGSETEQVLESTTSPVEMRIGLSSWGCLEYWCQILVDFLEEESKFRIVPYPGTENPERFSFGAHNSSISAAQYAEHTSSSEHMRLARYWLSECRCKHSSCRPVHSDFLPTRLIKIDENDHDHVHLHITTAEDAGSEYCTLSHSWGGATDILTLTSVNLPVLTNSIAISSLPKSFQDAVTITKELRVQFLWIDSLCIIQDSEEDWTREAAMMASVYENSTCTIAASFARNAHGGIFAKRNPLQFAACRIAGSGESALFVHGDGPHYHPLRASHLYTRGWILQETTLSPRILNFDDQGMSWFCRQGKAREMEQDGFGIDKDSDPGSARIFGPSVQSLGGARSMHVGLRATLYDLQRQWDPHNPSNPRDFRECWQDVITDYSKRGLTHTSDKLVALSAVAQRFRDVSNYTYVAGLWVETLFWDLLWRSEPKMPRPRDYRAPSWSWASVDSPVTSFSGYDEITRWAHIQEAQCSTHPSDSAGTGAVSDGWISMSARVRPYPESKDEQLLSDRGWSFWFRADYEVSPECSATVHLLPLLSLHDDSEGGISSTIIQGLAIIPGSEPGAFTRLGLFGLDKNDDDLRNEECTDGTLFDAYPYQDIVLR